MARTPRPILKTSSQLSDADHPSISPLPFAACSQSQLLQYHTLHVHFPPTPRLACTEITHSPNTYDRAPIIVIPNDCAIPDRGCRSYGDGDRKAQAKSRKRSQYATSPASGSTAKLDWHPHASRKHIECYFHPRAYEAVASSSPSSSFSSYRDGNRSGADREEGDSEDVIQFHEFQPAALPLHSSLTASWTPPLTRCSSPLLSSPFAASSDEPLLVPVPVHSQSQVQAQQQSIFGDGTEIEEMLSPSPAASTTTSLNALALTPLPYLPPSSPPSPKSFRKKKGAASVGENGTRKKKRDFDCLSAYTSPFSDPALDGCLGGF